MIVTAASIRSSWGQVDANLSQIAQAAAAAADKNSRLLLLPECCLTGADWPTASRSPTVQQAAVEIDSPAMGQVRRIARSTGVLIAVGLYERRGQHIAVSQALVGPRRVHGVYRKVHNFANSSREQDRFPVFDVGFARIGVSICYDNMFPECARILAVRGAELLLSPFTSLPLGRKAWMLERLVALRSRAQDNRMFVLSASHAQAHVPGKPSQWGYSGICCAVNPLGEVMGISAGRAGRPQSLTVCLPEKMRRTYLLAHVPSIRSRMPQAYGGLVDQATQDRYARSAPPIGDNESADRYTAPLD